MYNDMDRYLSESNILDNSLSDEKKEKLYRFYEILVEKNKVMNLTSITEIREFTFKHLIDSIALEKLIKDIDEREYSIADLGTGAGFPGIPLAITFPNLKLTLIDSLNKRIKFIFNEIGEQKEEIGLESMSDLAYTVYCYLSGNNGSEAIKIKEVLDDFND